MCLFKNVFEYFVAFHKTVVFTGLHYTVCIPDFDLFTQVYYVP